MVPPNRHCQVRQSDMSEEAHALVGAGLCLVGAWALLKLLQLLFSLLWPLLVLGACALLAPQWTLAQLELLQALLAADRPKPLA